MASSSSTGGCRSPTSIPTAWGPILIRDPQTTRDRLAEVASNRYSYRQLDDFTDLIQRTLQRVPLVAKVQRAGVLPEQIYLDYSHERLASFDFPVARIKEVLNARNVTAPAGVLETQTKNVRIDATAEFKSTQEIGDVLVGASSSGVPVYLRDLVSISRGYQSPHAVPELPDLPGRVGDVAPQPRDHPGRADALGAADRRVRQGRGRGARRRAARSCRPTSSSSAPRTSRGR